MRRREMLLAAMAAASTSTLVQAEEKKKVWPKVPSEWYGEGMYNELMEKGAGVAAPGPVVGPVACIAFDTQCPWCMRLHKALLPLYPKVRVVWYPVAVLNIKSEPQASMILSAEDPWAKFLENEEHFNDKDFRGLFVDQKDVWKLPEDIRGKVWNNSKIVRRNGTRTIPYGVYKSASGEYRPIYSGLTTEELARIFDL